MNMVKDNGRRFVNIEKKVGLFVCIAIIGIIAMFACIGIQQDVFSYKKKIHFITDNGKDISAGQPVTLSGFRIGKVKRLILNDFARVKVELSINSAYMKWIRKDSIARLVKELPMGSGTIEITPGSSTSEPMKEDDRILFEREKWLSDLPATITKVENLLDSVHQMVTTTNSILAELNESIPDTLRNTRITMKTVRRHIPNILHKTNKNLKDLEEIAGEIKETLQQTTPQVKSIIDNGSTITTDTKEIIDSVKTSWPIRYFIKKHRNRASDANTQ